MASPDKTPVKGPLQREIERLEAEVVRLRQRVEVAEEFIAMRGLLHRFDQFRRDRKALAASPDKPPEPEDFPEPTMTEINSGK